MSASTPPPDNTQDAATDAQAPCVLVFNANDPSGASGLNADTTALASVGVHALTVCTGSYVRDTAEIFEHYALDDDAVREQARAILEDVSVGAIKVGFVGTPENLAAVAEIASDYDKLPLVAYQPDLSWWKEELSEEYLEACTELLLPQTTLLVGNHSTLWRWLLPDWSVDKPPAARDIAKAASDFGVPYTLVTGIPLPDQYIDNILAAPHAALCSHKFERFEAHFVGAGETLSAALTALIASETELTEAVGEALAYLDQCLANGFRPGMGHVLPDRMFWASPDEEDASPDDDAHGDSAALDFPTTRH